MQMLKNKRTLSLLFWVILVIVAIITMPNLDKLVKEQGQITLPDSFESEKATKILNYMKNDGEDTYEFIFVTNDEKGLTNAQKEELNKALSYFKEHKKEYNITDTFFYNDSAQTEEQLVSADKTTIINKVSTEIGYDDPTEIAAEFNKKLKDLSVKLILQVAI